MYEFVKAAPGEFDAVRDFYFALIDVMAGGEFDPGWRKGIYPDDEMLRGSIARGELWLLREGGEILAAVIVNSEYNPGYEGLPWRVEAGGDEVLMLHALGVRPDTQGRGVGAEVVRRCIKLARSLGAKCIRLDVLGGNAPAERLYTAAGFAFVAEKQMYYDDTGWTLFRMFELEL